MNKISRVLFIAALMVAVFAPGVLAQTGYYGSTVTPRLVVRDDTTSTATYRTIVNVSGPGILYQLLFNSSSNAKDPTVRITIDGKADSVTEASSEELTRYAILSQTPNGTGADNLIDVGDSTNATGVRIDIPFRTQLKIEAKTETGAAATTNVKTIYGLYNQ